MTPPVQVAQRRLDGGVLLRHFASATELALAAGVTASTARRWLSEGIPERAADRVACTVLHLPTAYVWAEWFEDSMNGPSAKS